MHTHTRTSCSKQCHYHSAQNHSDYINVHTHGSLYTIYFTIILVWHSQPNLARPFQGLISPQENDQARLGQLCQTNKGSNKGWVNLIARGESSLSLIVAAWVSNNIARSQYCTKQNGCINPSRNTIQLLSLIVNVTAVAPSAAAWPDRFLPQEQKF